jgi:hypothetical protein
MPKLIGDSRPVFGASCEKVGGLASGPMAAIRGSTDRQIIGIASRLSQLRGRS